MARKIARFAPTTLTADTSRLTPKDRQAALDKLKSVPVDIEPIFPLAK